MSEQGSKLPWYTDTAFLPPTQGIAADLPATRYMLPRSVAGIDREASRLSTELFHDVALPMLRDEFPYYVAAERVTIAKEGNEVRTPLAVAFRSEAVMLRLQIDAAVVASQGGSRFVISYDNDITHSKKREAERSGFGGLYDDEWDVLDAGQQRSVYHQLSDRDLAATVTRPAAIVGPRVIRDAFGSLSRFSIVSSNTQDYLDKYIALLNERAGEDLYDPNYTSSYTDGRFAETLRAERERMRAVYKVDATKEELRSSPTLKSLIDAEFSPPYEDAGRFVNYRSPYARTVSAQELKLLMLLHLKAEDPDVNIVHFDDMPSAMRKEVVGLQYITLPRIGRFRLLEDGTSRAYAYF